MNIHTKQLPTGEREGLNTHQLLGTAEADIMMAREISKSILAGEDMSVIRTKAEVFLQLTRIFEFE